LKDKQFGDMEPFKLNKKQQTLDIPRRHHERSSGRAPGISVSKQNGPTLRRISQSSGKV
jgi:hypothetical protein